MPYTVNPAQLDAAYASRTLRDAGAEISFFVKDVGALAITSGQIAASDPLVTPNPPAFLRKVPIGSFPVRLAVARLPTGDERVAFARVDFCDSRPVRWEPALVEGQDARTLGDDEYFGYGVDSAIGCFMDARAGALLEARMDEKPDYADLVIEEMDKTYCDTWSWTDFRPDDSSNANIICFSTGFGDGMYPSFFGLDASGKVAALVSDFMILTVREEAARPPDEASKPPDKTRKWWQFWRRA